MAVVKCQPSMYGAHWDVLGGGSACVLPSLHLLLLNMLSCAAVRRSKAGTMFDQAGLAVGLRQSWYALASCTPDVWASGDRARCSRCCSVAPPHLQAGQQRLSSRYQG